MDKELSRQVSQVMLEISAKLNESVATVQDKGSIEDFDAYRQVVGRLMGEMYVEIMHPIYQQYPDLKPPELD